MNSPTDARLSPGTNPVRFRFLQPDTGPKVWMSGDEYRVLLDAQNSANTMTLIDAVVPPGGGPPVHSHADVDELFVVLQGELEIMADDTMQPVRAGGRVFVRRNVPHAFINRTEQPAHMLIFYTPAGVEEYFLAAGRPAIEGVPPPAADATSTSREVAVAARHGIAQESSASSAGRP
jgi:quercetin dioxygenase-like cupin family protein